MTDAAASLPSESARPLPQPPAWLDEVTGEQALAWVGEHNAATASTYESDPVFTATADALETILASRDKIPAVTQVGDYLYNFWTDADHPRGLWRRTTWESYLAGAPGTADAASTSTPTAEPAASAGATKPAPSYGEPEGVTQPSGVGTDWQVLLDLDALSEAEGAAWVWHGASVLRTGPLAGRRALVDLSDGGSDTDITRELDLDTLTFVDPADGGFTRTRSKGWATWADEAGDTILMGADWGPGSLTSSGYPRQVRLVRRGQDPASAPAVLTVPATSVGTWAHRDRWGQVWLAQRPDFYTGRTWRLPPHAAGYPAAAALAADAAASYAPQAASEAVAVDVPLSAEVASAWDLLLIHLREEWTLAGTIYPAGSLLAARRDAFLAGDRRVEPLFTPTASAFLQGWSVTASHLVLHLLDDVVDTLEVLTPAPGAATPTGRTWGRRTLDVAAALGPARLGQTGQAGPAAPSSTGSATGATGPHDGGPLRPGRPLLAVSAGAVDPAGSDRVWLTVSSFTQPTTLAVGDLDPAGRLTAAQPVRQAPQRYEASDVVVTQHVAISDDGTRVPYFQVSGPRADSQPGGNQPGTNQTGGSQPAPTILYGYGGFEHSLGIGYLAAVGKAWLERGGTYVVASIRGGGEYGPAWHQAGLRADRHRVYEDFAAVARALTERGVTTPEHLAVHGGSNGGLLVGNMLTQYPDLVGAVICEVPLLDMRRYTHLLAGASWAAEYGDPDDPEQWAFIRGFSPFHLLRRGVTYPPVLLVTSTRDDRVHPAHARTMAWRMEALGQVVTYYENAEGGHGRATTDAQRAWVQALEYTFAWRHLHG